jgi:hypothetical protein
MTSTYGTRPIKRSRRTQAEIAAIKASLHRIANHEKPATVRQLYYRLEVEGLIDKTEATYKTTVCRLLANMRRSGELPFDWIADNTRWMRKPRSFSSLEEALQDTADFYRRRLWNDQHAYVEVWLEKDALAGVVYPITAKYDVPLMVTRGYPSLSFLHDAAEEIRAQDKPTFLYYLGDLDPSGMDISRKVKEDLVAMSGANIHFERLAVNADQIELWQLPTRPTKRSDTRAKHFDGPSVEVDAIPPTRLRTLVEQAILKHIDHDALSRTLVAEQSEREFIQAWGEHLQGDAP